MSEENKETIRRYWQEVFSEKQIDKLAELATEHEVAEIGTFHKLLTGAIPDLNVDVQAVIGEGDLVGDVVFFTGTMTGQLTLPGGMNLPPSGKPVNVRMVNMWRLEGGKIAEHWGEWDVFGAMRQMGMGPPGGGPPGGGPPGGGPPGGGPPGGG